MHLTACCKTL